MMKLRNALGTLSIAILLLITTFSCSNDDAPAPEPVDPFSLAGKIENQQISNEKITAIGFSSFDAGVTFLFYHIADGAVDIELFKTQNTEVDRTNYNNYREFAMETRTLFGNFEQGNEDTRDEEYFAIVKYTVNNEVRLSNPIKMSHTSQTSVWTNEGVGVTQSTVGYPRISWANNFDGETSYFFCILTNSSGDTFVNVTTEDTYFQYFNIFNTTNNFTQQSPEALVSDAFHRVYLLDINNDNWLNRVVDYGFFTD
jgi:hypothetical protein